MVNHHFLQPPFGNYDLFVSKAPWPSKIKEGDWYILQSGLGFQRPLGGKNKFDPNKNCPKRPGSQQVFGIPGIFCCNLQEVNSQCFGRTRTERKKHTVDVSEIWRENPVDM